MRYLFVLILFCSAFTAYIMSILADAKFRGMVANSFYNYLPESIITQIIEGGVGGTFLSTAIVALFALVAAWGSFFLVKLFLRQSWVDSFNHSQDVPRPNPNGLLQEDDKIQLMVTFNIPTTGIPASAVELFPTSENIYKMGEAQKAKNQKFEKKNPNTARPSEKGYNFSNLMPISYIRVDRETLEYETKPKDGLDALYRAGLGILYKHREWPAAVGQNHAGALLLEHSLATSHNLDKLSNHHPCASVAGLFHDIGKILAYEKRGSKFKRLTKNHDMLSLNILINLPEFKALPDLEKGMIRDLVQYGHSEQEPVRLSNNKEFLELKRLMSYADGSAVQTEIEKGSESVANTDRFDELVAVVWKAISSANINNYLSLGLPTGFCNSKHEVVFIPITNLIKEMAKHASPALSESLMLEVDYHQLKARDLSPTLQALRHLGLLNESYGGVKTESGLYVFKSSSQKFSASVLLDKNKIFEIDPSLEGRWGDTQYVLTLMRADV